MNRCTCYPPVTALIIAFLVASFVAAGCEYNTIVEEPLIEDPTFEEPLPRFVQIEPTLKSIEDSLFQTTCTTSMCHNSTTRAAQLNLSRNTSYTNLVNVPSLQDSSILRVYPGKPDSSYLIWKIKGDPDMKGRLMPICASDVQCLDTRVIEVIREWIANGAPRGD